MEMRRQALEEERRRREELEKRLQEETSRRQRLVEREVKLREKQRSQVFRTTDDNCLNEPLPSFKYSLNKVAYKVYICYFIPMLYPSVPAAHTLPPCEERRL